MSSVTGHAMGSPAAHSPARSVPLYAATTPSAAAAAETSTELMRADPCGLRTSAA